MAIKAVILDLGGTLVNETTGTSIAGVPEMVAELQAAGIQTVAASYNPAASRLYERSRLSVNLLLTRNEIARPKGSKLWVRHVLNSLECASNELLYIGDTEQDMREAVNSGLIYFNASWSAPSFPYGIPVTSPALFSLIVRECFQKDIPWYWTLTTTDDRQRPVQVRALMDGNGAGIMRDQVYSVFKQGQTRTVGPLSVRAFVGFHLLSSIYTEGLYQQADVWTVYPRSSSARQIQLGEFGEMVARLFRDAYIADLLVRHRDAPSMHEQRMARKPVQFTDQFNTVHLNPTHRQKVVGNTVVVIDDFTTDGYSSECARNLLFEAGARSVLSVNVGKYGRDGGWQSVISPRPQYGWDPYLPMEHDPESFSERRRKVAGSNEVLEAVRHSYQRVRAASSGG